MVYSSLKLSTLTDFISKHNMEKINIGHSFKDIPIPNKQDYMMRLLEKTEDLIARMRWKAFFFTKTTEEKSEGKYYYGFKSQRNAPSNKLMEKFEKDIFLMIRNIRFNNYINPYQKQLKGEVKKFCQSEKIFIKADKTNNLYEIEYKEYDKLLTKNLTKNYRKVDREVTNLEAIINKESRSITDTLKISDRVGTLQCKEAYCLAKDHKTGFINDPQTRLINPAKSEVGKISKKILEGINQKIKEKLKLNQWVNTKNTIDWFKNIDDKNKCSFIQFDIIEFYPSITRPIFEKALEFAKLSAKISIRDIEIITHCRKSILFRNQEQWTKISGTENFDVAQGSGDSAEVSDLVGLYLLHNLTKSINIKDIGLYRDDGLMVVKDSNGPKCERMRKFITQEMKKMGFKLEVKTNIKVVDFLDITLNLKNNTYQPYMKPNTELMYVNINSNHPNNIIKEIPKSIENRLRNNSCNEKVFNESKGQYIRALKNNGYKNIKMDYNQTDEPKNNKNRKRKTIWYNPPFNTQVHTNVGKVFLNLIDKNFPQDNLLHKIFNRNTLKISYSCMDNMNKILKKHNNQIIRNNTKKEDPNKKKCNCRVPSDCPIGNRCKTDNVVYLAEISSTQKPQEIKYYIGSAHTSFKKRFSNHIRSFSHQEYANDTSLSTKFWELDGKNLTPTVKWKILRRAGTCKSINNSCRLCLSERLEILKFPRKDLLLNKKTETAIKCLHKNKYILKYYIDPDPELR